MKIRLTTERNGYDYCGSWEANTAKDDQQAAIEIKNELKKNGIPCVHVDCFYADGTAMVHDDVKSGAFYGIEI